MSLTSRVFLAAIAAATASCVVAAPPPGPAMPSAAPSAVPGAAAAAPAAQPGDAPAAGEASAAPARPPVKKGAPALPTEEADADDLADGPETWDDLDWDAEALDLDWEEGDLEEALGYDISDLDYFGGEDEDGDGDLDAHALADIELEGLGEHEIEYDADDEPLMSEEPDVTRFTDKTTGQALTFVADQEFNSFLVAVDDAELTVEFDPAGEIYVDGEAHETLEAAARAIVATEVGGGASLHSLAFVHGMVLRREDATRGQVGSNVPQYCTNRWTKVTAPCGDPSLTANDPRDQKYVIAQADADEEAVEEDVDDTSAEGEDDEEAGVGEGLDDAQDTQALAAELVAKVITLRKGA